MEAKFWLERWQRGEIGFHETMVHPLLIKHWQTISSGHVQSANNVFVPLCGKSLDMLWLIEQGFHVYGVELSALAVDAFFQENNIPFEKSNTGSHTKFESEHATIFSGDILSLAAHSLPAFDFFYDRAALVALPLEMREAYVNKVSALLKPGARGLLISLEYEVGLINPPPHCVDLDSVYDAYGKQYRCDALGSGPGEVKGKPCIEHAIHLRKI